MHQVAPLARQIEGDPGNAVDFRRGIELGVDALAAAVVQSLDAARLAEIDAAGELAHDHDVQAGHQFGLERGGLGQRLETDGRAQVGEQFELLAQAQQALFRLEMEGVAVPLGAADRAEHHGVARFRLGHDHVGDRRALGVQRRAADQAVVQIEFHRPFPAEPVGDPDDLVHHFGADAVARQDEEGFVAAHGSHSGG